MFRTGFISLKDAGYGLGDIAGAQRLPPRRRAQNIGGTINMKLSFFSPPWRRVMPVTRRGGLPIGTVVRVGSLGAIHGWD